MDRTKFSSGRLSWPSAHCSLTHHVTYTYTTQQTVATSYLSSYTVATGVLADGQKNAGFFGEHQQETIVRPECPKRGARATDIRLCRESGAEE